MTLVHFTLGVLKYFVVILTCFLVIIFVKCTCFCKGSYDAELCRVEGGDYCLTPYQDRLFWFRNVLARNEIFGSRKCYSGYEGIVDGNDHFMSCHLSIYEPTYFVRNSISIAIWISIGIVFLSLSYYYLSRKLRTKYLRLKKSRRKSRRSSIHSNDNMAVNNNYLHLE